jgi:hypothetical protein
VSPRRRRSSDRPRGLSVCRHPDVRGAPLGVTPTRSASRSRSSWPSPLGRSLGERASPASRGRRRAGSLPSSRHFRRRKLESSPVRPRGFPRLRNGWRPSSMGFGALRRFQKRAATDAGVASPGYAASSGFLNLLTLSSARNLSSLVSCRLRPWAFAFRGFPSPVAGAPLGTAFPSCRSIVQF